MTKWNGKELRMYEYVNDEFDGWGWVLVDIVAISRLEWDSYKREARKLHLKMADWLAIRGWAVDGFPTDFDDEDSEAAYTGVA